MRRERTSRQHLVLVEVRLGGGWWGGGGRSGYSGQGEFSDPALSTGGLQTPMSRMCVRSYVCTIAQSV